MHTTMKLTPPEVARIIREHIERKNPGVTVGPVRSLLTSQVRGSPLMGHRAEVTFDGMELEVVLPDSDEATSAGGA